MAASLLGEGLGSCEEKKLKREKAKEKFLLYGFLKCELEGAVNIEQLASSSRRKRERVAVDNELQQVKDRQKSQGFIVSLSCTLFLINKETCFISKMNKLSPIAISPLQSRKITLLKTK